MKITFSNLGTIKKTTLDLRPLTVIIGPNNSNKTYIAYSIYGLFQSIFELPALLFFNSEKVQENDNIFSLKIDNELIDSFLNYCNERFENFINDLDIFFQDSSKSTFIKTNYKVEIKREEIKTAIEELTEYIHKQFYNSFEFKLENNILIGKVIKDEKESSFMEASEDEFAYTFMRSLIRTVFSSPVSFPAERNAFIITYKNLENRRYKLLKKSKRNSRSIHSQPEQPILFYDGSIPEPNNFLYPRPIEDFLDFLTEIEFKANIKFDSNKENNFYQFADLIEKNIQKKNKVNYRATKLGGKELKVTVKKGLDIDLYNASSSIKQLTPLLFYLRYFAEENHLLIIDEPEMNLHPESQAKFLEILGMLVNAGIKVLLTTHSPYFMSHLNNLVSGKTGDEKTLKKQAKSLYLKDERAFLKFDDVSAYEMKNNKLVSLKDKDYGIRWDTLSDVSADIQQKFFEIYEKGEEPTNGKEE